MTKLFIENANREASASIRIYPLDENSQVVAPDSFTSMDDLGLSFGIALAPKTGIDCTGVVARGGGIIMEGDGEVTITGSDEVTTTTREETLEAIRNMGFRVDVLTLWGSNIKCDGGLPESDLIYGSNNRNFEVLIDGVSLGDDFFFHRYDAQGDARLVEVLSEHGIEIEFVKVAE